MAQTSAMGHRPSASQIVPAIPHSLGPKPRPRNDQPAEPSQGKQLQTPPESRDSSQADAGKLDDRATTSQVSSSQANGSPQTPADASKTILAVTPSPTRDVSNEEGAGTPQSGVLGVEDTHSPIIAGHQRPGGSGDSVITAISPKLKTLEEMKASTNQMVPPNGRVYQRPARPAGGLVFGSTRDTFHPPSTYDGTSGSTFDPQSQSRPHHGPHPGATPFVPSGHAYHLSEPSAGQSYALPFATNSASFEHSGQFYGPQNTQNGHLPFYRNNGRSQGPPRAHDGVPFQPRYPTPPYAHPSFNQRTTLHSPSYGPQVQPPTAIHPSAMRTNSSTPDKSIQRQRPAETPHAGPAPDLHPSTYPLTPFTPKFRAQAPDHEASLWLGEYIHGHFGVSDFADVHLRLSHTANLFAPTTISGHGLLLSRSPKLRSLMATHVRMPPSQTMSLRILDLAIYDRFLSFESALSKAIMRLYADPLPTATMMTELASASAPHLDGAQSSMRYALSYAAAGHFLQIGEIVSQGLDVARSFLSWKNVDIAMAFALDGGLSLSWHQREGSQEDKDSTSSFDGSQSKPDSPTSTPTYGYHSDRMLERALKFITESWPKGFKLHTDAPQLLESPRLPILAHAERARSRSQLTSLRFGEMTVTEEVTPDLDFLMLSSILFSLPLPALRQILENETLNEKLGGPAVADLARATVAEREQRRGKTASQREAVEISSALEERLWHNVRWVELVEANPQHASGVRITRQRLDSDTPPTSHGSARS